MTVLNRTLSNLDPGKRYIIRVRAKNKLGVSSEWSESISFEPQESGLDIDDVQFKVTSGVKIIVAEWKTQDDIDLDHYELHVSTEDGFTHDNNTLYSKPRRGTLTVIYKTWDGSELVTLEPNTMYHVQLWAVDTDGEETQIGEELDVTTAAGDTKLDPVEMFTADQITAGTITAGVTVSGQIQTATSGSRVVLGTYAPDKIGLAAYSDDDNMVLEFDTDTGNLYVRGEIKSEYGPDLLSNPFFGDGIEDWATDIGGKMWFFGPELADSGREYWVQGGGSGHTVTVSQTSDVDKTLFGDDGSLSVAIGAGSGVARVRSTLPSVQVGHAAPVTAGDSHSAVVRIHSPAGIRAGRVYLNWFEGPFGGYASISTVFGAYQYMNNTDDSWSELTISDQIAPANAAYCTVGIEFVAPTVGDVYYIAFAGIETTNPGAAFHETTSVPDGGLVLLPGGSPSGTVPQISLVHSPPGKTSNGAIEVEGGEFYNVSCKFFIEQFSTGFLPDEYIGRVILVLFLYDDDTFVSMKLGSGFSDRGYAADSGESLTSASETFEIPTGITKARVGVAFVATNVFDYIVIDDVRFRKSSVITASVLRAGASDGPRIEIQSQSRPSVHFHPTGRVSDFPGEIRASTDLMEMYSPKSSTGNIRRAGLRLRAGQTIGSKLPPTYAFDAYPVSFLVQKDGVQAFPHNAYTKVGFSGTSEVWDPLNVFSTSSDTFTVPEGYAGVWILYADNEWEVRFNDGVRRLRLLRNGSSHRVLYSLTNLGNDGAGSPDRVFANSGMTFTSLNVGDEIELQAYWSRGDTANSASDLNLDKCRFGGLYLGGSTGN